MIAGGLFACAPLFKRISNALGRLLSFLGFFAGIVVAVAAAGLALFPDYIKDFLTPPSSSQLSSISYLQYYLPLMIVLGLLLFARPIRNVRWASLMGLAIGLLASYYVRVLFPTLSSTILAVVFIITTLAIYTLLRFVEDIFEFMGTVLAFPPIAIGVGLVSIYFGIVMAITA